MKKSSNPMECTDALVVSKTEAYASKVDGFKRDNRVRPSSFHALSSISMVLSSEVV